MMNSQITHLTTAMQAQMVEHAANICSNANWLRDDVNLLSHAESAWLFDNGSLTSKLQKICDKFEVLLLTQGWESVSAEYAVRQVLLCDHNIPLVWGITVIRHTDLAQNQTLKSWKQGPLGHLLFSQGVIEERKFEIADFSTVPSFESVLSDLYDDFSRPIWARRAEIRYDQIPLTLTEVFLPSHPMYGVDV